MSILWKVFIVLGVILDLGISGYLIAQNQNTQNNTNKIEVIAVKSGCWDHVLDRAVTDHPTRESLIKLALECRALPSVTIP